MRCFLKTGCKRLDKLIKGFPIGEIALVYGESGAGKTTLAIQASIEQAKEGKQTIFVCTKEEFPAERAMAISAGNVSLLRKILVKRIRTFEEQENFVLEVEESVKEYAPTLIVFDTITFSYRAELSESIVENVKLNMKLCLLYTSPSPRDRG